jgi:hypothetical protein
VEEDQLPPLLNEASLEGGGDLGFDSFHAEPGVIHVVVLSVLHGFGGILLDEAIADLQGSYSSTLEFENGERVAVADVRAISYLCP